MINFKNVAKDSPSNSFSARSYLKAINFLWVKNRSIKAWTLVYCVCTARSQHAGLANPTFLTLCKKAKLMKCGSPKLNVLAATQSKFLCPSLRNRVLNEFSFSTVHMRAGYKYRLIYRTRAIITRSWSETALVYKPRILGLKNEEI